MSRKQAKSVSEKGLGLPLVQEITSERSGERLKVMGDGTNMSVTERLEVALSCVPRDQRQHISRSPKQLERYLAGADIPLSVLIEISAISGVPVDWLAAGRPTFGPSDFDKWREGLGPRDEIDDDYVFVRLHRATASAGGGLIPIADEDDGGRALAFQRTLLNTIGVPEASAVLIEAEGVSMTPTIPDRSLMLVNRSETDVRDGCVYVLVHGEEVKVKRLQRLGDGRLRLLSDNPDYEPVNLPAADMESVRVIGRVRWIAHRV